MNNIKRAINTHNKRVLNTGSTADRTGCNCRNKDTCPLPGECLTPSVVYQATVSTPNTNLPSQTYVGLTEGPFKTRFNSHASSFNNINKKSCTELSARIWKLKEENIEYNIKWKILARAQVYSNTNPVCNLCLTEKYFIIFKHHMATLNTRNELISTCRHLLESIVFKLTPANDN